MNWYLIGAVLVAFVLPLLLKRIGTLSEAKAIALLAQGAKVVDVRTEGEFASAHLPGAINVPLNRMKEAAPRMLPDKATPVLVHCHTGSRSQIAKRVLRTLGYAQVHNLGSYGRAAKIVKRGG